MLFTALYLFIYTCKNKIDCDSESNRESECKSIGDSISHSKRNSKCKSRRNVERQ